jgi:hypothetical protein
MSSTVHEALEEELLTSFCGVPEECVRYSGLLLLPLQLIPIVAVEPSGMVNDIENEPLPVFFVALYSVPSKVNLYVLELEEPEGAPVKKPSLLFTTPLVVASAALTNQKYFSHSLAAVTVKVYTRSAVPQEPVATAL